MTIYGNLCRPNVQEVLFVSFGPGETYNFIGSHHFEIFRSPQWGHRKGVLVRTPQKWRILENVSLSYPVESGSGNIKISSEVVIADFVD